MRRQPTGPPHAHTRRLVLPNRDFAAANSKFLMAMPIVQPLGFAISDVRPGRFEITRPRRLSVSAADRCRDPRQRGALRHCIGATARPQPMNLSPLSLYALVLLSAVAHAAWNALVKGARDPLLMMA